MNNAPSNQTGANNTFSQGGSQSNPFTADLKGEFTSNFGTNTNAVSQIFKEGGFVSSNRTKYLLIAAALLVVLAGVFYFYTSSKEEDDTASEEDAASETADAEKPAEEAKTEATDAKPADTATTATDATAETKPAEAAPAEAPARSSTMATGDIVLSSPSSGSSVSYDETTGGADFTWDGPPGGQIVFSRSRSMSPEVRRATVRSNRYTFHNPWPGKWYWRVENGGSASDVRSFRVDAPPKRNISVTAPQAGAALAANGGVVSWQGADRVAFYRVELSTGGWANPNFRFATSATSVAIQNVTPGQYNMRVGAFSEVSGKWEYTQPVPVTIQ